MNKKRDKGQSHSTRPARAGPPRWLKLDMSPSDIELLVVELAKKGYPPSMIGIILRDQFGIPLVKQVIGKKIEQILEKHGIRIVVPEDVFNLMKRAVNLRRHLDEHPKDMHSKRGLIEIESKIHRLVKYYKRVGKLPADWKYDPETAKLIVSTGIYKFQEAA
ncbi:MAG: 30S ribosomal protein S15 [Desulfurococcaceae archaeon]|jgi:small subunit ribosomal protein S15|nr:30S ribosomal protein S15 [Desulfurococcaceae archaeon]MCC6054852.1 30S ribosomal protein S15 [Thermosphaera sp.]